MALTSSSHASSYHYHVFLSFRGEDTRHGFTGYLYKALTNKGIRTFIDDEGLQSGEEITPALEKSIKESRIAIIVLSKDYASSSFCLDELATIIDCKSKGMLVIPVFYEVDPSDVRHQRGSYREALTKHEERFQHEKLQKWKMAMNQVANLSGYHFKEGNSEYKFIDRIVASVSEKINHPARLRVGDYLVGLDSRVAEVMKLLDVESDDGVHIIGIHGMGGVGKSTLARAVYNDYLIAEKFDGSCYLENVKEESQKQGLKHLQSLLLQEILRDKNINVTSVQGGAPMISERLKQKKVLLLLDDVDNIDQLKVIVGSPDWLGPGSRVIITTRDEQLLKYHEIKRRYEVKELGRKDALQLLTWNAFKKDKADPSYEEVLNRVVTYASGLPLALEVIGSHLFGKSIEEWESAIDQYKRIPHKRIQDILKASFDALQNEEKSAFLDIACCLKGLKLTVSEVEDILHAHYGHSMKYHVGVLFEKSLIKFHYCPYPAVTMHDLIEDMGKEIVRGKRSRLWSPKHIREVLEHNTGTDEIEIICVDFSILGEDIIKWDGNAFKNMSNLKTLIIRHGIFSEGPKILPKNLRVLEWWGYPSNSLPFYFLPKELAICKLPYSRCLPLEFGCSSKPSLKNMFFSSSKIKYLLLRLFIQFFSHFFPLFSLPKFMNLTTLNFDECEHLTQIPDVSSCPNLEKLSFSLCPNLVAVHESIGSLYRLQELFAIGCEKLENFPPIHLISLRKLDLSCCWSLESFPEILGKMENISELNLCYTPIKEWPTSFQYLTGLQSLHLNSCRIDGQLLSTIDMMPQLRKIEAIDCKWGQCVEEDEGNMRSKVSSKLKWLVFDECNLNDDFFQTIGFTRFDHVTNLDLKGNNFTILPECIKEFQSLLFLDVSDCKHLQEIKGVPPNLLIFRARNCESLSSLSRSMLMKQELYKAESGMSKCILPGACVPEWFDLKSRGLSTSFWFRNKFPHEVLCLQIAPMDRMQVSPIAPIVFINGKVHKHWNPKIRDIRTGTDHTYIFSLYDLVEEPLDNEWNHVEVTYAGVIDIKATGIHLFKKESKNEDIRFTDPHSKNRKSDCHLNSSESQIQQLLNSSESQTQLLLIKR